MIFKNVNMFGLFSFSHFADYKQRHVSQANFEATKERCTLKHIHLVDIALILSEQNLERRNQYQR
jgi:hypothetical protein